MRLAKSEICNSNWQVKNSDGETAWKAKKVVDGYD